MDRPRYLHNKVWESTNYVIFDEHKAQGDELIQKEVQKDYVQWVASRSEREQQVGALHLAKLAVTVKVKKCGSFTTCEEIHHCAGPFPGKVLQARTNVGFPSRFETVTCRAPIRSFLHSVVRAALLTCGEVPQFALRLNVHSISSFSAQTLFLGHSAIVATFKVGAVQKRETSLFWSRRKPRRTRK